MFPINPIVLLAHKIYDLVTGSIGHSGYEFAGWLSLPPSLLVSVTHHDQHHRYSSCNYSTHFTIWDRLMGTLCREHDAEAARNIRTIEALVLPSRKSAPWVGRASDRSRDATYVAGLTNATGGGAAHPLAAAPDAPASSGH